MFRYSSTSASTPGGITIVESSCAVRLLATRSAALPGRHILRFSHNLSGARKRRAIRSRRRVGYSPLCPPATTLAKSKGPSSTPALRTRRLLELALPILDATARILREMASFESAGVIGPNP